MSGMAGMDMPGMNMSGATEPHSAPKFRFPTASPSPGSIAIFVQIKRAGQIETAVFDANGELTRFPRQDLAVPVSTEIFAPAFFRAKPRYKMMRFEIFQRRTMELRKDPITRSWVVVGHRNARNRGPARARCARRTASRRVRCWNCRGKRHGRCERFRIFVRSITSKAIRAAPPKESMTAWTRSGRTKSSSRRATTRARFTHLSDEEIERVLEAYALRIADLKRDARFKYVTVTRIRDRSRARNGRSRIRSSTPPLLFRAASFTSLRSAREWYRERERCVFCDILRQEIRQTKRIVDSVGDYYAFCPYASRVPYETWIMPKTHNHQFEAPAPGENRRHLATLLGRTLRRLAATHQQLSHGGAHRAEQRCKPRAS